MVRGNYWQSVGALSLVMACRMLGLFMLMPVFSVVATSLHGATPFRVGLALAAYGLTQAIFQIPFGSLSDRWGRRPVIAMGLVLFALGSVLAAMSTSIYGVIAGRALQGAGAVGSTILALVADLTPDEHRAKAMAVLGMGIGVAFALAMVLGPITVAAWHLSGLFWLMLGLSLLAMLLLWVVVPQPPKLVADSVVSVRGNWSQVFHSRQLLRLDFSIFSQHAILTALFLALPLLLTHVMGMSESHQSLFYLLLFFFAFVMMVPGVIVAEKKRKMRAVFILSVALMLVCLLALIVWHVSFWAVAVLLLLFFTAFTLMESILPSCVSKEAPLRYKGTAMGVYSTSQFLGIFVGGLLGGWALQQGNITGVFICCAVLCCIWLVVALRLSAFPCLSTVLLPLRNLLDDEEEKLTSMLARTPGVAEVALQSTSRCLYLKIDRQKITENALRKLVGEGNLRNDFAENKSV